MVVTQSDSILQAEGKPFHDTSAIPSFGSHEDMPMLLFHLDLSI